MDKFTFDNTIINDLIKNVCQNSKYFNQYLKDIKIDNYNQFLKIPTISKLELLKNLNSSDLKLVNSNNQGMYARVTSGTTSKMAVFYRSDKEIEDSFYRFYNSIVLPHLSKDNKCIVITNFTLSYIYNYQMIKSGLITTIGNPYDLNLTSQMIIDMDIDTIRCSPSTMLKIGEILKYKGYNNIKNIILSSDMLSSAGKKTLKEWFPNSKLILNFGSAELGGPIFYQCNNILENQWYHSFEEDYLYEFINIETGLPSEIGEIGELVITKLSYDSPLIRYRTNDLFKLEMCECGKIKYGMIGRKEDQFKIKGITLFKKNVDDVMELFSSDFNGLYQLFIDEVSTNDSNIPKTKISLNIQLEQKGDEIYEEELKSYIQEKFQKKFFISPNFNWNEGIQQGMFLPVEINFVNDLNGIKIRTIIDNRL